MFEEVQLLTHSSIRISKGLTLYFDPFRIDKQWHDADIVFITHDHFDHFSPDDIQKVANENTVFVFPKSMNGQGLKNCSFINPDETVEIKGAMIKGVAAYNKMKPFHTKGRQYVGYIVTMGNVRYYIAGDTDMTEENSAVECDVALVPVGGKYTMNYKEAAKLINHIKPRLAIPTHYGDVAGSFDDGKKFAKLVDENIEVKVMM